MGTGLLVFASPMARTFWLEREVAHVTTDEAFIERNP